MQHSNYFHSMFHGNSPLSNKTDHISADYFWPVLRTGDQTCGGGNNYLDCRLLCAGLTQVKLYFSTDPVMRPENRLRLLPAQLEVGERGEGGAMH